MFATKRFLWLDATRGIAACLVMISHIGSLSWVPWDERLPTSLERFIFMLGSPSVDIFFVLSGFVITNALLQKPLNLGRYFGWRLTRLMPVVWFSILLGWLVKVYLLSISSPTTNSVWHDISLPVSTHDWLGFFTLIYPFNLVHAKINMPLWSIQAEMLFIIAFPLAFWLMKKCAVLSFILLSIISILSVLITYNIYFFYLPLFFIGMLIAISPVKLFTRFSPLYLFMAGIIWIVTANVLAEYYIKDELGVVKRYLDMWGAALLILSLTKITADPPLLLQHLGKVSYTLYAIHLPIIMLTAELFRKELAISYWLSGSIGAFISILLATALYPYIEKPFATLSKKLR